MTNLITAIILLLLALGGIVVRKTYYAVPARELKRRAAKHDRTAVRLYRAVAYGNSLRSLLWLYIGLTGAASLIILARILPVWVSLLIVGPLLWIAFSLLPASRTTRLGTRLTMLVTPPLAWLLDHVYPTLSRGADAVERRYRTVHTGLFERDDLLELLEQQQHQPDSRLSDEELEIVTRTLRFDDYRVGDVMTPRKKVKTVLADDTLGPILIDEVHKSGQDFALVRASSKGEFVGTLAFRQLNIESKGKVRDTMRDTVYYLHEDDSLGQGLHAFFVTNCPLFVVVNSFEEYVGTLTINDLLKQLLGHIPGDDFDQYSDLAMVAGRHVAAEKSEADGETDAPPPEKPAKTGKEVVE